MRLMPCITVYFSHWTHDCHPLFKFFFVVVWAVGIEVQLIQVLLYKMVWSFGGREVVSFFFNCISTLNNTYASISFRIFLCNCMVHTLWGCGIPILGCGVLTLGVWSLFLRVLFAVYISELNLLCISFYQMIFW